jgi:quercetin dioxygenase-like cupin family protein
LAVLAGGALLSVGAGAYAAGAASRAPAQATRVVLAQAVDLAGAHGRTLALSRVTIPAHTRLALHRHPGTQIASIQKGTLTYTVRTRAVTVHRGPADENPRVVRRITAGHTGPVHAGEWVVERPGTVHSGANEGDRPLVILLATLFKEGRPPSIPVGDQEKRLALARARAHPAPLSSFARTRASTRSRAPGR